MPIAITDFRDETKGGGLERIRASQAKRNADPAVVDEIVRLDILWRQIIFSGDNLRRDQKTLSKTIGGLMKTKPEGYEAQVTEIKAQVAAGAEALKKIEADVAALEALLQSKVNEVGNYVHETAAVGVDEDQANKTERTWGECKNPDEMKGHELQHHHELLYRIGGYEPVRGVNVAGHRGYFLTGPGVLLNQALIQYGLSFLMQNEYTPVQPPLYMKKEVMAETAQLSQFDEELYKVSGSENEEFYLIATSEQPISAYHRHEWLAASECPKRYAGVSTCFRKEAGSHGRDAWGIFRIHQFEKIEQFTITAPEDSWAEHEKMIALSERFYQSLGLAYRVINICSAALNNAAAKKYDLEAWFPTLSVFRELVSCSNCTDYQSRAMEIRFGQKKNDRDKTYVHMLNATLTATERTICCILENYQTPEGVRVPTVLQPYMGGLTFMPFKRAKMVNTQATQQAAAKAAAPKAAEPSV